MEGPCFQFDSGRILAELENSRRILAEGISFSIAAGESLALIGETGSGKTMIALAIMGLLPENVHQEAGFLSLCGHSPVSPRERQKLLGTEIVYIPQNGLESLNPSRRVRHLLFDGLQKAGVPRKQREAAALENLRKAGFAHPEQIMELYPFQLSGGMAQRIPIALAAGSRARLVIADEPTNGLDADGKRHFLQLLNQVFPQSARLIITHDLSVAGLCDRVFVLCGGMPMETGDVLAAPPRHPYTRALLNALVENGMQEVPQLRQETGACSFYRRCPQATELCRTIRAHHQEAGREWWCNAF